MAQRLRAALVAWLACMVLLAQVRGALGGRIARQARPLRGGKPLCGRTSRPQAWRCFHAHHARPLSSCPAPLQAAPEPIRLVAPAPAPAPGGSAAPAPSPAGAPAPSPAGESTSQSPYDVEPQECAPLGALCLETAGPGDPLGCCPGLVCRWWVDQNIWGIGCAQAE